MTHRETSDDTDMPAAIEPGSCAWLDLVGYVRELDARSCWEVGDIALKIVPEVSRHGGDRRSSDDRHLNFDRLRQFSAETEISYPKLHRYRTVSHAWPSERRISSCSHRVHLILAPYEDRFTLIRPGMKEADALEVRAEKGNARDSDQPVPTLLSVLNEIIEAKRRVRAAFRAVVSLNPGEEGKEQVLSDLAELEAETEQFRQFLVGMGLDEAIEKIMEGS